MDRGKGLGEIGRGEAGRGITGHKRGTMHSTVSGLVGGDERRTRIVFGWRDTGLG
ncbi:MAG: hypothetical protein WA683_08155 [Pseudolabrys sp.]